MEWGMNWLQPINQRIAKRFSYLTSDEIEELNTTCRAAMRAGHDFIYATLERATDSGETIAEAKLHSAFEAHVKGHYEWVSTKNLHHMFGQGMYYAWKDGLGEALKT